MLVLIGGGSGFIGRHLRKCLVGRGHKVKVISRSPDRDQLSWTDIERLGLPGGTSAVVNLTGESVLKPGVRWNESFKNILRSSRIDINKLLVNAIAAATDRPRVWVSTSATGYYPNSTDTEYTENSAVDGCGDGGSFLSRLCVEWERSAELPAALSHTVRHVTIRLGIVLGRDGGTIEQLYLPFFIGLGGSIGSGSQWFPWIHVRDAAGIYARAVEDDSVTGVLNAVAPQLVTNAEFTKAFARALWRPALIRVPGALLRLVYGREAASIVTEGARVLPTRTLQAGYKFVYPDLESACHEFCRLLTLQELRG